MPVKNDWVNGNTVNASDLNNVANAINAGPAANSITNTMMADDSVGIAELSATGTPSSTTYLRGDNTWATPSGGGGSPVYPSDTLIVQVGNTTRSVGYGDFATGFYVGRAFTATKVVYQFDTADGSGSTAVQLRRNGTLVTSSNLTVSAANQADGTSTDAARSATISQSFAIGDRMALYISSIGSTPGKGLRAWIVGTYN